MSVVERLFELIKSAKVYDLGQPYWQGMPVHPADPPFLFFLYRYHEHTKELFKEVAPGFADSIGLVVSSMHAGTHFDTPLHMSRNLKVLGEDITRFESDRGYVNLPEKLKSVDLVPPLVLKAVLFDVARYKGVDVLPERYEITPEDLELCAKQEGVSYKDAQCALIRTGYSKFFERDADTYLHKFAGIGVNAAKWLVENGFSVIGIDNLAAGVPKPFEVHNIILSDNGRYLVKSLNLEALSADKKFLCLVVISPLKIKGGEASLVRPIAIA
ncbi:hypothetical protein B9Q13_01760 [Candidatus Marsarchaeota G2 archaeon ECH_B_SAG-G16]|jgi:kynurenine formamidase|uniref:Cyclase n=1 Tax=Candidatus Marsarchaeota G2 archaeon ECH_B_SAG-G16 TaxID=1978167 RepID=A0A2R6C3Z9_9ARCH|nr:MAG: hypothetical protein B9Q13_01760 [Candidatus Marsarchaeota G2 archaeon ECH_B_SAG-G16]